MSLFSDRAATGTSATQVDNDFRNHVMTISDGSNMERVTLTSSGNLRHEALLSVRLEAIENGYLVYVDPGRLKDVKRIYIASLDELSGVVAAQVALNRITEGDR